MRTDTHPARLVFGGAEVLPAGCVIKAADRERWRALEALRHEADTLIENEVLAATERAAEQAHQQVCAELGQRLVAALAAFDEAAAGLEQQVLALAVDIAARVMHRTPVAELHAAALQELHALVPAGAALRLRIHPDAAAAASTLAGLVAGEGPRSRQVAVVVDAQADDPLLLQLEHAGGVIDLGAGSHFQRVVRRVREMAQAAPAPSAEASP